MNRSQSTAAIGGRSRHSSMRRSWRAWVLPLLLLVAWEWASRRGDMAAYVFVPLETIWAGFIELLRSGELLVNLKASLVRTLAGLLAGAGIGIATGSAMAMSTVFARLVGPLYHAMRQIPILGLIPLIGLWFGSGDSAKFLVIALAAFYPTVLNTYDGLREIEKRYLEVGRVLTLSRWQTFVSIQLPGALPAVFTGISHALSFAWLSSMGSELLFTAGAGLGSLLMTAENGGRMDIVIICVLSISLIGYGMNASSNWLRFRLLKGVPLPP